MRTVPPTVARTRLIHKKHVERCVLSIRTQRRWSKYITTLQLIANHGHDVGCNCSTCYCRYRLYLSAILHHRPHIGLSACCSVPFYTVIPETINPSFNPPFVNHRHYIRAGHVSQLDMVSVAVSLSPSFHHTFMT